MTSHGLWITLIIVAGCWRDAPVQEATESAKPAVTLSVCPAFFSGDWVSYLWAHELFPGCPPAPFETLGVTCTDAGCPMPCRSRTTSLSGGSFETTYAYADGRFVQSDHTLVAKGSPVEWREHCDYEEGRLASCKSDHGDVSIVRDTSGRITEIHILSWGTDYNVVPTYAANGEITKLHLTDGYRTSTIHRDAAGRVSGETEVMVNRLGFDQGPSTRTITYDYDAQGRWVRSSPGDASYTYNARGALVRSSEYSNLATTTTAIAYDAQHRPRRIAEVAVDEVNARSQRITNYEYDCR